MPELVAVKVGAEYRVSVRVSFDQLQAVVRPGAANFAAGGAAMSFASAMASIGKSVAASSDNARTNEVSWLGAGGRYDLVFVRPADARTDSSAALADRTIRTCGAAYRSELAVACAHCGAERTLPWGRWRLADAIAGLIESSGSLRRYDARWGGWRRWVHTPWETAWHGCQGQRAAALRGFRADSSPWSV